MAGHLDRARKALAHWCIGVKLSGFEHAGIFSLRLEHPQVNPTRPAVLRLDVLSSARFGSEDEWSAFWRGLPIAAKRGEPDAPALAYRLQLLVGASITAADIDGNGRLSLAMSDGDILVIDGSLGDPSDLVDTSWVLYPPPGVPSSDGQSIHCGAFGEITVR